MAISVQILDRSARIAVSGRFEFVVHSDLKNAYTPLLNNVAVHEIEIEMSEVNYLDSAALGMLLILKDHAEKVGKQIVLLNASSNALRALESSSFIKLFNVKNTP